LIDGVSVVFFLRIQPFTIQKILLRRIYFVYFFFLFFVLFCLLYFSLLFEKKFYLQSLPPDPLFDDISLCQFLLRQKFMFQVWTKKTFYKKKTPTQFCAIER